MNTDRIQIAESARSLAHRALETSRIDLDAGDARAAINRAYYAAFYMASAALALVDKRPKTHKGTHNLFYEQFVATGRFPREIARLLRQGREERETADYDFIGVFDTMAASDFLHDIQDFVEEAESLVDKLLEEENG